MAPAVRTRHLNAIAFVSMMILMLLGLGAATATTSKAVHIAVDQHVEIEQGRADIDGKPTGDHSHAEGSLHLLGACAAVLGAGIAAVALSRARTKVAAASTSPVAQRYRTRPVTPAVVVAQPSRLALCVQIC